MLEVLSLMSKVVFSPLWVLWKFYGVLWWAFGDSSRLPAAAACPGSVRTDTPGAAFEIVDSRAPETSLAPPVGLLRAGFIGTLGTSVLAGIAVSGAAEVAWVSAAGAWGAWAWATCLTMVGSIFAVRTVARRRAAIASLPKRGFARLTRGVKSAVQSHRWNRTSPAWSAARLAAAKARDISSRAAKSALVSAGQCASSLRDRLRVSKLKATPPVDAG
ncbi:MAG: hypothetical protein JNK25_13510 [Phycisphaerae bacterium]|nr:hypothetical protein [Phycisphaerae bacterium]